VTDVVAIPKKIKKMRHEMKKFYITTAIDYVNSIPHLGTAYEKIGADVIARYKRKQGFDTFFLMGVDEHSLNVEKQAKTEGISPKEYCDKMVVRFKDVWRKLNISYDDFIRTTDERHKKAVQHLMQVIYDKGDIYKGKYKGWYCVSCEAFLKEKDLTDKKCPIHNKEPQWIEEDNYFFRLSKYKDLLLTHISTNPEFIRPEIRMNEIVNVLKGGLEDISISRSSVGWGIPVPFDTQYVIYVWFDALINYISGLGYPDIEGKFRKYWPCDLHVIGKDITRFHSIIWPAMLMAGGVQLPNGVWGHGFVYLGEQRMSKTLGTAVNPLDIVEKYGSDSIRYFLMREVAFDRDGEFTWEKFIARYQADLANDLGNLVQRVLSMVNRYDKGLIYKKEGNGSTLDSDVVDLVKKSIIEYQRNMDGYQLSQALANVWDIVSRANRYVEESKPWTLFKDGKVDQLQRVLYNLVESIRIIAVMVEPFMPVCANNIWVQLCNPGDFAKQIIKDSAKWGLLPDNFKIGEPKALFPKIE
jgi:methionyl-tRNA synthetase